MLRFVMLALVVINGAAMAEEFVDDATLALRAQFKAATVGTTEQYLGKWDVIIHYADVNYWYEKNEWKRRPHSTQDVHAVLTANRSGSLVVVSLVQDGGAPSFSYFTLKADGLTQLVPQGGYSYRVLRIAADGSLMAEAVHPLRTEAGQSIQDQGPCDFSWSQSSLDRMKASVVGEGCASSYLSSFSRT